MKYVTPTFYGLQLNSMYGFSNNAGNFATNRSYSFGASYAGGPWRRGAAYVRLDIPAVDTTGAIPSDNYFSFAKGVTKQAWSQLQYALREPELAGLAQG